MDFYIIWFELLQELYGKLESEKKVWRTLPEILQSCNRKNAGKTAPAHGLYLEKVDYL